MRSALAGPTVTISAPSAAVAVHLHLRSVARHHHDALHAEGARRVGHSLRVVAAGIRDYAALALRLAQRSNLVVGTAQLERADRLKAFGLQPELSRLRAGSFARACLIRQAGNNASAACVPRCRATSAAPLDVFECHHGFSRLVAGRRAPTLPPGSSCCLRTSVYFAPARIITAIQCTRASCVAQARFAADFDVADRRADECARAVLAAEHAASARAIRSAESRCRPSHAATRPARAGNASRPAGEAAASCSRLLVDLGENGLRESVELLVIDALHDLLARQESCARSAPPTLALAGEQQLDRLVRFGGVLRREEISGPIVDNDQRAVFVRREMLDAAVGTDSPRRWRRSAARAPDRNSRQPSPPRRWNCRTADRWPPATPARRRS